MRKFRNLLVGLGLTLIVIGYLVRWMGIYFFWESRYIGFMVLLIGMVIFLSEQVRLNRQQGRKTIWVKIGMGIILFILLIQTILLFVIPRTDAYAVATRNIKANHEVQTRIGNVKSISVVPKGMITMSTVNNYSSGEASFFLIVKAEKKFVDVSMDLLKE